MNFCRAISVYLPVPVLVIVFCIFLNIPLLMSSALVLGFGLSFLVVYKFPSEKRPLLISFGIAVFAFFGFIYQTRDMIWSDVRPEISIVTYAKAELMQGVNANKPNQFPLFITFNFSNPGFSGIFIHDLKLSTSPTDKSGGYIADYQMDMNTYLTTKEWELNPASDFNIIGDPSLKPFNGFKIDPRDIVTKTFVFYVDNALLADKCVDLYIWVRKGDTEFVTKPYKLDFIELDKGYIKRNPLFIYDSEIICKSNSLTLK